MKYYNCENATFVKKLYDQNAIAHLNNDLRLLNTEIEPEAHVCYVNRVQKNNSIFHIILLSLPCSDGKVRSYLESWNEKKGKFTYRSGLICKKFRGANKDCEELCNLVATQNFDSSDIYALIQSKAKRRKTKSIQNNQ